jgi:glutamate-1-semialdehyde 2,1-aminomutase
MPMDPILTLSLAGTPVLALAARGLHTRLQLSRAKHPSLTGHARIAKRLARLVPFYEYGETHFFSCDEAPAAVVERRRAGFARLAGELAARAPRTLEVSARLESSISDLQFVSRYRVPFQFRDYVRRHLPAGAALESASGVSVTDLDGNQSFDLAGSYGVNLFGYDFYRSCIDAGIERVRALGPVLGTCHPIVEENVERLRAISGMDEVSFHMSGTEAVMQAVRLARYHTGRSHLVQFCGAYHGWWDGVQPGVGNPRPVRDVYVLRDLDEKTLRVLETRRDIACVLVNPLQALHPNQSAPGDGALIAGDRRAGVDREGYAQWLRRLRDVCTRRDIALIFDEVFVGFRLAHGGAQEYFSVRADLVTYGKTLGGGLPVGVVCGRRRFMRRFREDRPTDICFARGTFNTHPYVMGAMNEFLRRYDEPAQRDAIARADETWAGRAAALNARLAAENVPVRVAALTSIWTVCYEQAGRYHWLFQYYLRAAGLALSWVGSGRLIFSHNYTDAEVEAVGERFVAAARRMREDGWWDHGSATTSKAMRRQVLREMIAVRTGWGRD